MNFRYLAPPIAVLIILLSVFFAVLLDPVLITPVIIYFASLIAGGIFIGKKITDKLLMPFVLATMHLSWGIGFITSPKKLLKS
jgi:uncharacterized protein YebE (UPF0316 family)